MIEYTQEAVDKLIWEAEARARRETKRIMLGMLLAVGGVIIVPDRIAHDTEFDDYMIDVEAQAGSMCIVYRATRRGR